MLYLARIIAFVSFLGVPVYLLPYINPKLVPPKTSVNTGIKLLRFPDQFFHQVYDKKVSGKKEHKELQYAPLDVVLKTFKGNEGLIVATTSSYGKVYNEHLEPRTAENHAHTNCYNQHQGQEVSVSRSPGHNVIYKSYPLIIPRAKPFKFTNNKPTIKQTMDTLPLASTAAPFLSHDPRQLLFIRNNQGVYVGNPDRTDNKSVLGDALRLYGKKRILHLNVARTYNLGPDSQKGGYSAVYSMGVDHVQADMPTLLHLSMPNQAKFVQIKIK